MLGLITIGFVGRLGELPLSVAILATSIFNAAGLSILTGLAAAMETFCGCVRRAAAAQAGWGASARCLGLTSPRLTSPRLTSPRPLPHTATHHRQAYGGGSYALVGVVLQRAMLLTVVVVTLVGGVLSQMGPILKAAGQDHAIADGEGARAGGASGPCPPAASGIACRPA